MLLIYLNQEYPMTVKSLALKNGDAVGIRSHGGPHSARTATWRAVTRRVDVADVTEAERDEHVTATLSARRNPDP